nr:hypothetical protein BaRGS_027712 [Batillaria attramentaria]
MMPPRVEESHVDVGWVSTADEYYTGKGRLEIVNGGWVMSDAAVTYYNDIIDQHTLGFDFVRGILGTCAQSRVAWHVDQFGHSREHAAIFAQGDEQRILDEFLKAVTSRVIQADGGFFFSKSMEARGTEQQGVADDYNMMISIGIDSCHSVIEEAYNEVMKGLFPGELKMAYCPDGQKSDRRTANKLDVVIKNKYLKVTFDGTTGLLKEVRNLVTDRSVLLSQDFAYYASNRSEGLGELPSCSGAYVFSATDSQKISVGNGSVDIRLEKVRAMSKEKLGLLPDLAKPV